MKRILCMAAGLTVTGIAVAAKAEPPFVVPCDARVLQLKVDDAPRKDRPYSLLLLFPRKVAGLDMVPSLSAAVRADSVNRREGLDLHGTVDLRDEQHHLLLSRPFQRLPSYGNDADTTRFEFFSAALPAVVREFSVTIDNGCHLPLNEVGLKLERTYQGK